MAKASNTRFLPALAVCLLASTALCGSAQAGWFSSDKPAADGPRTSVTDKTNEAPKPAADLDSEIRKAQLLRAAGSYDAALKNLSQLMIVAADDGRVVTEYGKTLAAMGRAQEAVNFLTRAQQLQGNDWTIYNALGVSYDELGNQNDARTSYEHALALQPGDAAVLNNYALSRMMANDPATARTLMARAQSVGGASDPKIARNIALIDKFAAPTEAPKAMASANGPSPSPAPHAPVAAASLPAPRVAQAAPQTRIVQAQPFVNIPSPPAPTGAPRVLQPAADTGVIQAQPQMMAAQVAPRGVVMQAVPVDPQAGPVISLHMPAPKKPKTVAKADAPAAVKTAPVKAASAAEDLQARADAIAKTLNGKPAAIAQAKAEAEKPMPAPAKTPAPKAVAQNTPAKPVAKADLPKAVAKVEMSKPTDVKAVPVKTAAKKDTIPALRMSANAF